MLGSCEDERQTQALCTRRRYPGRTHAADGTVVEGSAERWRIPVAPEKGIHQLCSLPAAGAC